MAPYCILDIETVPHPDAHQWADPVYPDAELLEPIKADSRLKDPAKVAANLADVERREAERPQLIAANIAEKTAIRDEKFSFDPDMNRIVALGAMFIGHCEPFVNLFSDEYEERYGLIEFAAQYRKHASRLVTFNGFKFDIPVLMRRAMYLDVDFPEINIDRFKTSHIDLWQKLSHNGVLQAHSLKFYSKRMGFDSKDPIDGSMIAQLVKEERWAEVEAHCLADIGTTHALANRLGLLKLTGVAA